MANKKGRAAEQFILIQSLRIESICRLPQIASKNVSDYPRSRANGCGHCQLFEIRAQGKKRLALHKYSAAKWRPRKFGGKRKVSLFVDEINPSVKVSQYKGTPTNDGAMA